jgi:PAS domain S-box-containing protein
MSVSQPLVQASLVGEAIDQGPVLVLVSDEDENYVAVNQYACDVLGYTREELLALKASKIAPDATPSGRRASGRMRLRRKDGAHLEVDYRGARTTVAGMTVYVSVALAAS